MTKDKALAMAGNATWATHTRTEVDTALAVLATYVRELEAELSAMQAEMNRALAEADMHRHDADSLAVKLAAAEAAMTDAVRWVGMQAAVIADSETGEPSLVEAAFREGHTYFMTDVDVAWAHYRAGLREKGEQP